MMLEIFHVQSIPDSGCQRLGKRRGKGEVGVVKKGNRGILLAMECSVS